MKACSKCGKTKPLGEYHRRARGIGGRHASCKPCRLLAERVRHTDRSGDASQFDAVVARVARAAGGQLIRVIRTRAESSYECRIGSETFARSTILALETRGVLRRMPGPRGPSQTYTLTREMEPSR